jgi:hypothetical protein
MNDSPRFARVLTLRDLETLDIEEVVVGYVEGRKDDPEPGANRGRAVWHGWRCGMMDAGRMEIDDDHRALVAEVAAAMRDGKWSL